MTITKEEFEATCQAKLVEMNLDTLIYKKRLSWEMGEIVAKSKLDYFWTLYTTKTRYPINQNNLLVCKLLGICKDYKIEQEPNCEYGEYPDIDIDYLGVVRDYLKTDWAKRTFGAEYVCNIGNYTTFKIKSALIDMARVHGESREEIQKLTKNLDDKDDEGKAITWDAAMKLYPDLKKYCEEHPAVADAAKRLLHRNRGMGVHAGGLIIANIPLSDMVPLVKRKDNPQASAWVEGLNGQDLGPVGLVKFDLLVISNLLQIAKACKLIKERHGLTGICNLPGQGDWTDVKAWRDDPVALAMADKGDLKGIFQFDKDTVRGMARRGGVTRFEDLVAYTSLNRPGPLGMNMDKRYIERKRGREPFTLHPLVRPILEKTYGVLTYQEQIMRMLNVVGEIPLKDCELVRKAISKKKVEGFIKYKEMFITNGAKNLGISEASVSNLWDQIEAFAEYGFNLSHAVAYTYISGRLLWLKAHYPHEFYTAILSCETLAEKMKEYKTEAFVHKVNMRHLDINKSKLTFDLVGDEIYFGMSNIKGIGEEPAKRILAGQPYKGFEDFLHRFGTDANVLKPLIGLRCFKEADPVTLWKFVEFFKDRMKKHEDKKKRQSAAAVRYQEQFEELTGTTVQLETMLQPNSDTNPFDNEEWRSQFDITVEVDVEKEVECGPNDGGEARWEIDSVRLEGTDEYIDKDVKKYYKMGTVKKKTNKWKAIVTLWNRYQKSVKAVDVGAFSVPKFSDFNPAEWDVDSAIVKELRNPVACEEKFYGFAWVHDLEKSPDYRGGFTFEQFRSNPDLSTAPVELKVLKVTEKESKKKTKFWQVECQDAMNEAARFNVWEDDWERWGPEFKKDNLLRVRLMPPSGGFPTYTFDSPPRHQRWKIPKNKDEDYRVVVMRPGQPQEDNVLTHEEALDQFDQCIMNGKQDE
jgi:DNA polymerase III alpha subunit